MSLSILIVSGRAGSGKSTALGVLEDHGYMCVDNLPINLIPACVKEVKCIEGVSHLAMVIDARSSHIESYGEAEIKQLRQSVAVLDIVYFTAQQDTLLRRFAQTRRRHPLDTGAGLLDAMAKEEELLNPIRANANSIVDTTGFRPRDLQKEMTSLFKLQDNCSQMTVQLISFGFKHGAPTQADIILDVRFLPNPYFNNDLHLLSGRDESVQEFVLRSSPGESFYKKTLAYLEFLMPRYVAEGKQYVVVGIGCTGGRHRSVSVVECLAKDMGNDKITIAHEHRDIERGGS
jgi:RNase adapter protein RapZ